MNILQIVPNRGWGGGEKYVWELSESLLDAGHRITAVIAPNDLYQADRFARIDPHSVPGRGIYGLGMVRRLAGLIRQRDIQIVHTHIFKHATAAVLAKALFGLEVKVVMTRHLGRPAKKGWRYNWLYRKIDGITFVAQWVKAVFLSSGPNLDREKLTVIHNSVRELKAAPEFNLREVINVDRDRFVIAFAGTLTQGKGVDFLVDLAERLRGPVFALAGTGRREYVAKLKRMISERGLEDYVKLPGRIEYVVPLFGQADAVIVPSKLREAFPLVVLEGMMARRPVIFSQNIPRESITEREGFPIHTDDLEGAVKVVREVMENKILREEKANRGYDLFRERYSYDVFLKRMIDFYEQLLTK